MQFSQRIGKTPIKELQIDKVDEELKNRLWNALYLHILTEIEKGVKSFGFIGPDDEVFVTFLYHSFFKERVDEVPTHFDDLKDSIKSKFFSFEWYEIYDFFEYVLKSIDQKNYNKELLIEHLNIVLKEEFSGFRVSGNSFVPITNKQEIDEIEKALNFTSLEGVNIHLTNALEKVSDKKQPDYRNSIKESISAVECACRKLTGESTLGKALNKLESKGINIDPQLKSGFEKIYNYTNNKGSGIRHAIIEEHLNPDFEDAKYMLVAFSSFINYLVGKNIKLN